MTTSPTTQLPPSLPMLNNAHAPLESKDNAPAPNAPPTNQPSSPLLALPAELRTAIWTLILAPPTLSQLRWLSARNICSDYVLPAIGLTPGLLRTCRQVHAEALPILYGENTFSAHSSLLRGLPFLVTGSRPVTCGIGREMIRKWYINVRLDIDARFCASAVEAAFSGAEELEIDVFQAMFGSCDYSVLQLFEGVRGVRKAWIHGSVGNGHYTEWLRHRIMCAEGADGEDLPPYQDLGGRGIGGSGNSPWELWMGNR